MPTIGEEVVRRYHALQQRINEVLGATQSPLPQLGDIDEVELVTMIATWFSPLYGTDYRPIIQQLMVLKQIQVPAEKVEAVYPDIKAFLDWTIETIRKN